MKEKDVWLNTEEIQALLQGSLHWHNLSSQETEDQTKSFRRDLLLDEITVRQNNDQLQERLPLPRLEGKPVVCLLGGVGLLTACCWCYYVLLA